MARFLIATMPFISHVNPSVPLARTLVQRGHDVWWYTGRKFQSKVEATGARYVPMQAAPDFDEDNLASVFPERHALDGIAQFKWSIKHLFMDAAIGQLTDLQAVLRKFPADLILSESTFAGGQFVYELGGPPYATFNILPLTIPSRDVAPFGFGLPPSTSATGRLRNRALNWIVSNVLFRDVSAHFNNVRAKAGLLPTRTVTESPFLYLQGTTPAFEYSRSDLPPQVHFIGPLLPEPPAGFAPPMWWDDLRAERPVVLVTQGTVSTDVDQLIAPTLRALADENVLVVATTGTKANQHPNLCTLPDNVRVERFLSYHHLMPHVSVMVTNGGYGSVQLALAHGIPLVAGGKSEDKPETCARIAWAGVGVNLKTATPTPQHIRAAVTQVLTNHRYRARAAQVKASFDRHHAPAEAAALLEHLAATKQPVLRHLVPSRTIAVPA